MWKKVAAQDIQKINIEFMKNIGGQTHIVCGVHNMPLVTMFDKIKNAIVVEKSCMVVLI